MPDPFVQLKQDHREVEDLLRRLSESKSPGPRRRQVVDRLVASLGLHMEIEEDLIYPAAKRIVGGESEKEAEIEHGLAREGLTKLQSLVDEPGFGAAVDMVTAGIKHHVKEEEHEMFPKLKRGMKREQIAELQDEIAARRRQA